MYRIGIDVGSTYTKYCVMKDNEIELLYMEKTPVYQQLYFEDKTKELLESYKDADIISCGYGRNNIYAKKRINELIALAKGSYYLTNNNGITLDIGGQDTKVIRQEKGRLLEFFTNGKCAAGSGLFLKNTLGMLNFDFKNIDLSMASSPKINLSSTCAIYAQSEIVELIADNVSLEGIVEAVIWQILIKAKAILQKIKKQRILFSGGLSQIKGIDKYAKTALGSECVILDKSAFITAIGCACQTLTS